MLSISLFVVDVDAASRHGQRISFYIVYRQTNRNNTVKNSLLHLESGEWGGYIQEKHDF